MWEFKTSAKRMESFKTYRWKTKDWILLVPSRHITPLCLPVWTHTKTHPCSPTDWVNGAGQRQKQQTTWIAPIKAISWRKRWLWQQGWVVICLRFKVYLQPWTHCVFFCLDPCCSKSGPQDWRGRERERERERSGKRKRKGEESLFTFVSAALW